MKPYQVHQVYFEFKNVFDVIQGKRMPDGSNLIKGDELNFINVNHRHSGIYTCTADNGFGEPVIQKK